MEQELVHFLSGFITPRRWDLFERVLEKRTRYITVVLEDIYQPHNASAVLRTCDCFGIQDVHIIENKNKYQVNPEVSLGASQWLSMYKYNAFENNTAFTLKKLKKKGYRIVSTNLDENSTSLETFNLQKGKCAIVFGAELRGISDVVKEYTDEYLKIPMQGFTESLNISVSAGIILHNLTHKMKQIAVDWSLTEKEKFQIKLDWLRTSIKRSDLLEKDFFTKREF